MSKVSWKPGNMIYPVPAVLVSCRDRKGQDNLITVAWTGTINTNPPMAYISVRPERYSYSMIKETGEFVINLTTKDMVHAVDYCGVKSGAHIDKWKETGLTKVEAEQVNAALIEESPVNIECRVTEIVPLGSHHMFVAEVVNVKVSRQYMDEKNSFDLSKANPIVYSHGWYYDLGKKLGRFGYSVAKKKHTNKKRKRTGQPAGGK